MKSKKNETQTVGSSSLDLALSAIEKAFGKGAVMFGNRQAIPDVEFRSSGCLSLDKALGGGWGKGRIIEVYGSESSGKTTLGLHAIAAAQSRGEKAAFIDVEHAFDPSYAEALGVNVEQLIFAQPISGEEALQIVEMLIGAADIIILDSVAGLLPQAEIDKNIGDATVGRQAGLMSQAMRKFAGKCSKTNTTLIFINQIRMKIGVMFGNPETQPGGNALKYYASQRVDVRRTGKKEEQAIVVANTTRAKIVKNKLFPPFREAEFLIVFGQGIDVVDDVVTLATAAGLLDKNGTWYAYQGANIGQGKDQVANYFRTHPEVYQTIWKQLTSQDTSIQSTEEHESLGEQQEDS